ncbi:hypothetical protein CDL12_21725 [Handroanthus impetiginosus]|uniref:Uncharacterized protein n=1 Tax=Handroanthus impetiginosus TaxID=429701 RepID=A0A2G9GKA9_9LAMI|nr:hypothetical protein CDL12_21725 [Handroanthus impetiginosus]
MVCIGGNISISHSLQLRKKNSTKVPHSHKFATICVLCSFVNHCLGEKMRFRCPELT